MTKRILFANGLLMLMLTVLLVPAQAQSGWPNSRTRDDDYRNPTAHNGAVVWAGAVDGEVIIRFRRNNAWVENLSGQGSWNERFRFSAPLLSGVEGVHLNNVRGRGEVVIIEQPNRRNNYTACVLVRDRQRGPSSYSFALNWDRPRYRDNDYNDDRWGNRDGRDRNDRDDRDDRDRNDRDRNGRDRNRDRIQ